MKLRRSAKRFNKIEAVSDVSLSIEEGQVLVFLEQIVAGKVHFFPNDGRVLKEDEGDSD